MVPTVLNEPQQLTGEMQQEQKCVHHWLIEPPTGMTSNGVCKLCGAQKTFDNFVLADKAWK